MKLSDDIEQSDPYYSIVQEDHKKGEAIVADHILYKNTSYCCDGKTCVLIHTNDRKSNFGFGIITKIIVKKNANLPKENQTRVIVVYQLTESDYMKNFDLFRINLIPGKFGKVNIEDLAAYAPVHLHTVHPSNQNLTTLASLHNKPILFEP